MQYQTRRYVSLLESQGQFCKPLHEHITCDIVVVWWWMAWLFAAKELIEAWKDVVLIEKNVCWWWMSGRSGGFLTPDSELWLRDLERIYGEETAKMIWEFGATWQQAIVKTATDSNFDCELQQQDSLLLWWKEEWNQAIAHEHEDRIKNWYTSLYIPKSNLHYHTTWRLYWSAVRYDGCYTINPMKFCQQMKEYLVKKWCRVYEWTTVTKIQSHAITTISGSVRCNMAIFAMGKVHKDVHREHAKDTYWLQNFITISQPLPQDVVTKMLPWGKMMCWDTKLVFTYYRFTPDNRLVLGWWDPFTTGMPWDVLHDIGINRVIKEMRDTYPILRKSDFMYYWSGRIEATKDLMPIVDFDTHHPNHIRLQGCVWLPRAAACGVLGAKMALGEKPSILPFFARKRKFRLPWRTNSQFLKSILVWANTLYTMKIQERIKN